MLGVGSVSPSKQAIGDWREAKLTDRLAQDHQAQRRNKKIRMSDKEREGLPATIKGLVWKDFFNASSQTLYFKKMINRYRRRLFGTNFLCAVIIVSELILLFFITTAENLLPLIWLMMFGFWGVVILASLVVLQNWCKNRMSFCNDAHSVWEDIAAELGKMHEAISCGKEISPKKIMGFSEITEHMSGRERIILGERKLKLVKAAEQETREMLGISQKTGMVA